jgi:ABC-type glycerol-3-phosphate transport system permease component
MVSNRGSVQYIIGRTAMYLILLAGSVFVLVPFAWTLSTSLLSVEELYQIPRKWIPDPPRFENYLQVMKAIPFGLYYFNTLKITALNILGTLLSCSLVAFAFARLQFRGKHILFLLVISTTMIPIHVLIIPRFVLFRTLGWLNSHAPLIVPSFFGEAVGIFLFRQFYLTIPRELDDAAKIDGCGYFGIYARIILPLARPVVGIVGVFTFIETWRDFFSPLIYIAKSRLYTISLGLTGFYKGMNVEWHLMMAANLIALVPPLVIFFIGQKYFLEGAVVHAGLKQ